MYKGLIFDLDGTLLNTLDDLADSANAVLAKRGLPIHPVDSYRQFVGNGAEMLVRRALGVGETFDAPSKELVRAILDEYNAEYETRWNQKTRPYKGIPEFLTQCSHAGIPLAVVSNKPDPFVHSCVQYFFPSIVFLHVTGQSELVPKKPDPSGTQTAIGKLGLQKAEILYVGDSSVDIATAENAGLASLGVSWGFRGRAELLQSGATHIIDNVKQLYGYVKSLHTA